MIGALLLSLATAPQVPDGLSLPHELEHSTLELSIQATETHFRARSYSEAPIVLFFGAPGSSYKTSVNLAPGSEVEYIFCRGCVDDVYVDALTVRRGVSFSDRWSATGALSLADVSASAQRTLWVQRAEVRSIAWLGELGGVELAQARDTLVPDHLLANRGVFGGSVKPSEPLHVPVITPEQDKDDSKPPVIEPTPLPPV